MIDYTDLGAEEAGEAEAFHYLHDALGSVIGLTDADGLLVERYTYDPYGRTTIERRNVEGYAANGCELIYGGGGAITPAYSAFGNPFAWTGQRYDAAASLYHFHFRTYSPGLGRWLQRDPAGYVDGVNLSEYVRSNPIDYTDSLGLFAGGPTPSNPGSGVMPPDGWPDNFEWDDEHWTWREGEGHTIHEGHYDSKTRRFFPEDMEVQSKRRGSPRIKVGVKPRKGLLRAIRNAAGAGAGTLLGFVTQYAEAMDFMVNPSKSRACNAWYKAALKGDCESMSQFGEDCAQDMIAGGLEKAGMAFSIFADKAQKKCEEMREERRKKEEEKQREKEEKERSKPKESPMSGKELCGL